MFYTFFVALSSFQNTLLAGLDGSTLNGIRTSAQNADRLRICGISIRTHGRPIIPLFRYAVMTFNDFRELFGQCAASMTLKSSKAVPQGKGVLLRFERFVYRNMRCLNLSQFVSLETIPSEKDSSLLAQCAPCPRTTSTELCWHSSPIRTVSSQYFMFTYFLPLF